MAAYLLFVDAHQEANPRAVLAGFGCAGLVRDEDPQPATAVIGDKGGPSGHAGLLILPRLHGDDRDPALLYRPEHQTWQQVRVGESSLWVGFETANPVRPQDLARDQQWAGPDLLLRDRNLWRIPHCFAERSYWGIGSNGFPEPLREPLSPRLYGLAAPWFHALDSHYLALIHPEQIDSNWNNSEAMLVACDLLAENYRLSRAVVLALGLLAFNDVPKIIAWATKQEHFVELQLAIDEDRRTGTPARHEDATGKSARPTSPALEVAS